MVISGVPKKAYIYLFPHKWNWLSGRAFLESMYRRSAYIAAGFTALLLYIISHG